MKYAAIAFLAILVLLIVNYDVFTKKEYRKQLERPIYRAFLVSVVVFHVTDLLWGIFHERHWNLALMIDTTLFFLTMAVSVFLWTQFVFRFLSKNGTLVTVVRWTGWSIFGVLAVMMALNFFKPIMFEVTDAGEYHTYPGRFLVYGILVLFFLFTSVYMMVSAFRTKDSSRRRRFTISLFGIAMIAALAFQLYFPLLPFYTLGYMLGCCVLHTFIVEDQRADYLRALEASLDREVKQEEELGATRKLAYTDPMTGVKSKRAYTEAEQRIDERIADGDMAPFGIVVFDLNGLKHLNDTEGHEAGDRAIIGAARLICEIFKHSPVFRIGGDEFVSILEGADYESREELIGAVNDHNEESLAKGGFIVSPGLSVYDPVEDASFLDVFRRADEAMYQKKRNLKERGAITRD